MTHNLGFFHRLGIIIIEVLLFPITRLPRPLVRALASTLGTLSYYVLARRRKIATTNILRVQEAGALPKSLKGAKVARRSFGYLALTILDTLILHQRGFRYFKKRYSLEGRENMDEATGLASAKGVGLILLTAHIGNWELSPHVMREEFGLNLLTVGRTRDSKIIDELMISTRKSTGCTFVYKKDGVREMLKALKRGEAIGTLYDQAAMSKRESAPLEFMGRLAYTNMGPVRLGQKTGSILVPLFASRLKDINVFKIFPPIVPPNEPDGDWSLVTAQKLNDILEEFIRMNPEEWLWVHRRWKTPDGLEKDPRSF
ncbi:MAG: hypothetical protein LBE38_00915 [Deltaproteobacteria bacterium]|jgi:KDO2-lipid IV(A) lauroyltransferase|nr:hypothetical protein [Deltaproteobacteria bacterium]